MMLQKIISETSLVVQRLRLHFFNAGGSGSTPGQELQSHMSCGLKANKQTKKQKQNKNKQTKKANKQYEIKTILEQIQ